LREYCAWGLLSAVRKAAGAVEVGGPAGLELGAAMLDPPSLQFAGQFLFAALVAGVPGEVDQFLGVVLEIVSSFAGLTVLGGLR
jgi:hypothetical protein